MVKPIANGRFMKILVRVLSTKTRSELTIVDRLKVLLPAVLISFFGICD